MAFYGLREDRGSDRSLTFLPRKNTSQFKGVDRTPLPPEPIEITTHCCVLQNLRTIRRTMAVIEMEITSEVAINFAHSQYDTNTVPVGPCRAAREVANQVGCCRDQFQRRTL